MSLWFVFYLTPGLYVIDRVPSQSHPKGVSKTLQHLALEQVLVVFLSLAEVNSTSKMVYFSQKLHQCCVVLVPLSGKMLKPHFFPSLMLSVMFFCQYA